MFQTMGLSESSNLKLERRVARTTSERAGVLRLVAYRVVRKIKSLTHFELRELEATE